MLTVTDLNGKTYIAEAQIPRTRVIGEREISPAFVHSDINNEFLSDIETGWIANFDGDEYWLYNPREDKHGNKQFDGLLDFVRQGNKIWHIDDAEDKSMTIQNSIGPLIATIPDYTLNIIDNFYANTMNYSNRQTTTERFLYFIERHNAEFDIPIGSKTIRVLNEVGTYRDELMIHEDDNLIDFSLDTQSSSFCTTVKGYYDFDDDGFPRQSVTFRSSLADKYGDIPGQPIFDERFNNRDAVYEAARKQQESTYQLSFTVAAELFDSPVNPGDYVPIVIPSKSINMYIRAVEVNELFDEDEDLIDAQYSFGNENIASLYRDLQYDTQQDITDMLLGKKKIPPSVLPAAMKRAFEIITGDSDSVMEYRKDRLTGHHDKDLGNAVEMNVSGLVFIRGGEPRAAITYQGVVTEALTAGTIDTNRIKIVGAEGYFYIDGDELFAASYEDNSKWFRLSPDEGFVLNRLPSKWIATDGRELIIDGIMRGQQVANIQQFNNKDYVVFNDRDMEIRLADYHAVYVLWDRYKGRYLDLTGIVRLDSASAHTFRYFDIQITRVGTGEVIATLRKEAHKTTDPEVYSWDMRIDLQTYFNTIVDYRRIDFYINARLVNALGQNMAYFRLNQGEFYG